MTHFDESAELYALGMLDELEAARVLAHARECPACAGLIERAALVVSALSEGVPVCQPADALRDRLLSSAGPQHKDRGRWKWFGGGLVAGLTAAALVILPAYVTMQNMPRTADLALSTIVASHFNHVSFSALRQGAPAAKALYGKHIEWIYVVVHEPPEGLQVRIKRAEGTSTITLDVSGENGTAFVPSPGAVREIDLIEKGTMLARAVPVASP